MCGFCPFSSSLFPSFPPTLPEWTWVSFSLSPFHSFVLLTSLLPHLPPLHYLFVPNVISFPIVWMDVCVCPLAMCPLLFGLRPHLCDWSPPTPPPLPPPLNPLFAKGAYALGAWSGYSSAGGGDWGEALCPSCFGISWAIWGQHFALELDCSRTSSCSLWNTDL